MKKISKYFITPGKLRFFSIFVSQRQWEKWSLAWNFFFILAQGRSGTKFLANLLNQAQGAYVFHEPVLEDFLAYLRAFDSSKKAKKYIQGFRRSAIYYRMRSMPVGTYGEVNSVLRCHVDAIREMFPNVELIHLVRDGRDVVRSIMSRNTFTIKSPYSIGIHPGQLDPWRKQWPKMDRFARVCWYWQEENKRLRLSVGKTVQFEKILSSYEYFSDEILEPCGLLIDRKDWATAITLPRNITSEFSMPKWKDWTQKQQMKFREICGEEMKKCGYSI